jgi:hypothetical protein
LPTPSDQREQAARALLAGAVPRREQHAELALTPDQRRGARVPRGGRRRVDAEQAVDDDELRTRVQRHRDRLGLHGVCDEGERLLAEQDLARPGDPFEPVGAAERFSDHDQAAIVDERQARVDADVKRDR